MLNTTIDARVRVVLDRGILHLTFARPRRRNAIDMRTVHALSAALDHVDDDAVRVVVLSADGDHFSVGGDIDAFPADPATLSQFSQLGLAQANEVLRRLYQLPMPLIVGALGAIAGAGIGFALTADILILGRSAFFSSAYSRIGFTPDCGTSWLLTRRLTGPRSADTLLTGRRITAEEAIAWGLATRLVDDTAVPGEMLRVAGEIAAGSSLAANATKRLYRAAQDADFAEQLEEERRTMKFVVAAADPQLRTMIGSRRRTPSEADPRQSRRITSPEKSNTGPPED